MLFSASADASPDRLRSKGGVIFVFGSGYTSSGFRLFNLAILSLIDSNKSYTDITNKTRGFESFENV